MRTERGAGSGARGRDLLRSARAGPCGRANGALASTKTTLDSRKGDPARGGAGGLSGVRRPRVRSWTVGKTGGFSPLPQRRRRHGRAQREGAGSVRAGQSLAERIPGRGPPGKAGQSWRRSTRPTGNARTTTRAHSGRGTGRVGRMYGVPPP